MGMGKQKKNRDVEKRYPKKAFSGLQLTHQILTIRKLMLPILTPRFLRLSSVHQYPDPIRIDHDLCFQS